MKSFIVYKFYKLYKLFLGFGYKTSFVRLELPFLFDSLAQLLSVLVSVFGYSLRWCLVWIYLSLASSCAQYICKLYQCLSKCHLVLTKPVEELPT